MNKIVCNVCGTSYPENASQCPICGFSRSPESTDITADGNESSYQYVKGGRFSKANVKKRNRVKNINSKQPVIEKKAETTEPEKKGSAFMVIVVFILLLAIIAVVGYIALRFFLPNDFVYEGLDSIKQQIAELQNKPEETLPTEEETEPSTSSDCSKIILDKYEISFDEISSIYTLNVTVEPANTPDVITFASSDEAVCTVSETGLITSVGEGNAIITVKCGAITAECSITCGTSVSTPTIELNRKEITFTAKDESWVIYDGEIPAEEITWSSDDSKVAKVSNGKIVAVANGDTTIHATLGEQTVSCLVHCKFESAASGESGEDGKKYSLYNPTGYSDDVTIKVGQKFTLKLVDEDKKEVKDATWSVNKKSVCSYSGSTVKGLAAGTAKITAKYNGNTYTCIVRVVK